MNTNTLSHHLSLPADVPCGWLIRLSGVQSSMIRFGMKES